MGLRTAGGLQDAISNKENGFLHNLTVGRGVFSKFLLECLLHLAGFLIVLKGLLVLP